MSDINRTPPGDPDPPHRAVIMPIDRWPSEQRRIALDNQNCPPGPWWDDVIRAMEDGINEDE
jgi:hypothetical protein